MALAAASRPPAQLLVNPDFDLSAELAARSHRISPVERISLMLRRYRSGRTQAIIENKLLAHSLLRSLGVPVAPILYGAFGSRAMGGWPRYQRDGFAAALRRLERKDFVLKTASDGMSHNVLLMSDARWHSERWTTARAAALAEEWILPQPDGRNRSGWFTRWGQRYEHRGVLLQAAAFDPQLLLCERYMARRPDRRVSKKLLRRTHPYCIVNATDDDEQTEGGGGDGGGGSSGGDSAPNDARAVAASHSEAAAAAPLALELRVYVAWGSLAGADGRARIIPHCKHAASPTVLLLDGGALFELLQGDRRSYAYTVDMRTGGVLVARNMSDRRDRHHGASTASASAPTNERVAAAASGRAAHYGRVAALLGRHVPALRRLAAQLRDATGADWFRLDVFLREEQQPAQQGQTGQTGQTGRSSATAVAPMVVNEVTYPGHMLMDLTAANEGGSSGHHDARTPRSGNGTSTADAPRDSLAGWLDGYRRGVTRVQGHAEALLQRLGIPIEAFAQSDFLTMDRPRDPRYFETTRGTFLGELDHRCTPAQCPRWGEAGAARLA